MFRLLPPVKGIAGDQKDLQTEFPFSHTGKWKLLFPRAVLMLHGLIRS